MSHQFAPLTMRRDAAEVARARSHVHRLCADSPKQVRELVVLLTSEVVTNAVQHGLGPIQLRLITDGDDVRIEVADTGTGVPHVQHPTPGLTHGRGMLIIDSLAHAWGLTPHPTGAGKTMWFTVAAD